MASGLFNLKQQLQGLIQGAWSGTSSSNAPKYLEYLVVAGGGGAGRTANGAGGGGGGGVLQGLLSITLGTSYTVTVGSGGAGSTSTGAAGSSGVASVLGSISAVGGGGGASGSLASTYTNATSGGSGGGGTGNSSATGTVGAQGTFNQGNAGGTGYGNYGGGGAGAGTNGLNAGTSIAGNGGAGIASGISGTVTAYAGGGAGGIDASGSGIGGVGGGGSTGASADTVGISGSANSGGGGGGGWASGANQNGGAGGSGIVIVRYAGNTQYFSGGTLSYDSKNNFTVHTFYASGTLAPLATPTTYGVLNALTKSLRFRSSNSAYLTRTPGSASNRTTWTWSAWVKRGSLATRMSVFDGYVPTSGHVLEFQVDNSLEFYAYGGASSVDVKTSQVFSDPSAWYHIVLSLDTNQATASSRVKMYVNGVQVTAFATATYPSQGAQLYIDNNIVHDIGRRGDAQFYFDGEMAEVNFIDGQQLTPQSFGLIDPTSGVWTPMTYVGSYSTNGFHLTFTNTTSTATLGNDTSGNSNTFTTSGFSLTAGATYDSMNDVPTLTSATVANYAVLNPNNLGTNAVLSNGNISATTSTGTYRTYTSTIASSSGSFYCEFTAGANTNGDNMRVGICLASEAINSVLLGTTSTSYCYTSSAYKVNNNSVVAYGATYTSGDVISIAFDGSTLTFYKNGTTQSTAYSGLSGTFVFAISLYGTAVANVNFGQQPFTYTPPSGYVALNTYNLPTPAIVQGNKYFDISLWNGNGTAYTVMNSGSFQPDFVWSKGRSGATSNILVNAVTGANQFLLSDSTQAEATSSALVSAFTSNGFSVGSSTSINNSGSTYVGWQWKANGAGSSNTNGSITSTVSVSTTAGFSVVTYTGTGSAATVGHGLGVKPSMIIIKNRSGVYDWPTWSQYLPNPTTQHFWLNQTNAAQISGSFNSTQPTSSVFSVGTTGEANGNTNNFVAYCFAPIAGFSAFGSYTGNGSTTGPFVYTGFQPKFVLIKRTDSASDWYIWDSIRNTFNTVTNTLLADTAGAETSASSINILSNGFQCVSATVVNVSTGTYIYAAFASNPFRNSNAF